MAPCRFCKHQGVAAGGLALLAALVVVGLALPGGAAAQQQGQDADKDVVIPRSVREACSREPLGRGHLFCASIQEKDIQSCCVILMLFAKGADDCTCGVLKVIEGRSIDLNNVCKTTRIEKECQHRAKDSNLDTFERLQRAFKRFTDEMVERWSKVFNCEPHCRSQKQ
ncbi:hypothetical protein SETIT_3G352900v2 [Setaria italica]|uniref:Bifunctional inhibitor/plant lipid transfer protein/seed storage helical domain-containing protein n=1 Tax=Setaria italica TaxID=4555 RepID=A0A368QME3_SETIT|nr:hypothetical protein SETIT_3G352900v2 [Setaria italica]